MPARLRLFALALVALGPAVSFAQQAPATSAAAPARTPPVAALRPHRFDEHGNVRIDPYYWLKERSNPEVIKYLEDENAYTKAVMAHTEALQDRLYEELKGRVLQNDQSVPFREGNYFYYTRLVEGKNYPIYARKRGSLSAPEEILIDANVLAEGKPTFIIRAWDVSSAEDVLAFAVDTTGGRVSSIRFKNLRTGEALSDVIPRSIGGIAWAEDNRTIFYTKPDSVSVRPYQVYRHRLGTPASADAMVYEDKDETYYVGVSKTKSRAYIMIQSSQTMATEYSYIRADQPDAPFRILFPRERGHEYYANHFGDYFYILSNDHAKNFRLMRTPVARPSRTTWEEVIPHRVDVLLEDFEFFKDFLVLSERKDGLVQLHVRPWSGKDEYYLDFGEPAYLAFVSVNREFDTPLLRYGYTSLTTPSSTYDYDMRTKQKTLLKRDQILGGFDPSNYVTERFYTTARDGARVPVSIVYRKGIARPAPLLLTGYGSYGSSSDPTFSSDRLSLLDRGFAFAIAHIRGGSEMGRAWYENGRQLQKKNTFNDFVDVADDLIRRGYTSPDRLFARGASAGGLLMGAVVNLRPELFRGVIAGVPYVDVITTMMDSTIPLTTGEYDEWGNPHDSTFYRYMLSYSPYDNVEKKAYPNMLITAGLYDTQVLYVEPAKWTARLRAMKTDTNRLILRTNMEAGHAGASGRYKRWRDVAFEYAFLLDLAGLGESRRPDSLAPPAIRRGGAFRMHDWTRWIHVRRAACGVSRPQRSLAGTTLPRHAALRMSHAARFS